METELSMTSSVSGGGVTLENVKRKLDETMDEPVMAKKLKTKLSSISLDVGQTDDDDDDDDNGDDEDDDDGDGDDDDDGSGGDRTDDGDDNVSLTSNNSNEIASDTRSKDHMVEAVRGTATATTSTKVSMAANAATAATTSDFMLAERSDQIECPMYGQIVNRREFRRAGPYLIGLKLGHSPVDSIVQYLAKKGNEFFQLKILVLNNNTSNEKLLKDERQGKMLLHQEYSLLSLLEHQDGVMQQHGLFSDMAYEEVQAENFTNNNYFTGGLRKRLVLVLDCVTPHDFDPKSSAFINLQQYLINRKKLQELEALKIFYEIVKVVENLHARNVIHRDLKLGNIVLNKHSNKVKIINFCLGKYLLNENELLHDQRGSPAYISPDVLCGKPYKGKPSDMWALGVVLFMMLYRQFPFFESTPTELFKKIKSAEYFIPINSNISTEAEQIIKGLLQLNAERRLTATKVRQRLERIIEAASAVPNGDRIVPDACVSGRITSKADQTRRIFKSRNSTKRHSAESSKDQIVPMLPETPPISPLHAKRPRTVYQQRSTPTMSIARISHNPRSLSNHALIIHNRVPMLNFFSTTVNQLSVNSPMLTHFNDVLKKIIVRRFHSNRIRSSTSSPSPPSPSGASPPSHSMPMRRLAAITHSSSPSNDSVKKLFDTFNTMYIHGRIPNQNRTNLRPFNGFITDDLAIKITMWLAQMPEPQHHSVVQRLFDMRRTSPVAKIVQFLRCCGIATETVHGQTRVKREQTLDLLMVMTYLLQAAGYSNAYFVAV